MRNVFDVERLDTSQNSVVPSCERMELCSIHWNMGRCRWHNVQCNLLDKDLRQQIKTVDIMELVMLEITVLGTTNATSKYAAANAATHANSSPAQFGKRVRDTVSSPPCAPEVEKRTREGGGCEECTTAANDAKNSTKARSEPTKVAEVKGSGRAVDKVNKKYPNRKYLIRICRY